MTIFFQIHIDILFIIFSIETVGWLLDIFGGADVADGRIWMNSLRAIYWRHMASEIWVNTDSGNGLVPIQHQAITWTNAEVVRIWTMRNILQLIESKQRYGSV